MSEIQTTDWSETASANNQAPPNGWPEGQAPSTVNDCARAMMAAVKRDWNRTHPTVTSGGTTSALTLTYSNAPTMADGLAFTFRLGADIGAGATLAVNGGTARALYWRGVAVIASTFLAGDIVTAYYNDGATRFDLAGAPRSAAIPAIEQGLHTLFFGAGGITPRATTGPARGTSETTTNKVNLATLDFDPNTIEYAQFMVGMPKSWNAGTITAQFGWTASSGSGSVVWAIRAMALSDDDAIDTAFGTAQTVTDALTATGDIMVSAVTSAVTIGNTPAKSDTVFFEVYRNATSGSDTLGTDAKLLWVKIFASIDAATDA